MRELRLRLLLGIRVRFRSSVKFTFRFRCDCRCSSFFSRSLPPSRLFAKLKYINHVFARKLRKRRSTDGGSKQQRRKRTMKVCCRSVFTLLNSVLTYSSPFAHISCMVREPFSTEFDLYYCSSASSGANKSAPIKRRAKEIGNICMLQAPFHR